MIKKAVYIENAPAKINLFLEIKDKREDGFHNIETLFQAINLSDTLTFEILVECGDSKNIDFEVLIDSNNEIVKQLATDNLVVRALEVFFAKLSEKVISQISFVKLNIFIEKNIPLEAGLAGGSSNAAATLRAFNRFFKENFDFAFSQKELATIAIDIGSDVPFCVRSTSEPRLYAESRGEEFIDPIKSVNANYLDFNYDDYSELIVVKPGFGISTREAYRLFKEKGKTVEKEKGFFNRFEDLLYDDYKDLMRLRDQLVEAGCDYAMLSGSGSTMLGFIHKDKDSSEIFAEIQNKCRGYEVVEKVNFLKSS